MLAEARSISVEGNFMRKIFLAAAAASMAVPVIPAPALAHGKSYYKGKIWQDSNGRYRCKRPNGTTGLIVGAAGGALVGRAIDTRGERATGTILGAAAGALLGRSIDRNRVRCR
jgi:Glycine zipper 2TM domain